jgi:hypothetical protein
MKKYKVTYKGTGEFLVRGISFNQGVTLEVQANIAEYIKKTFGGRFVVEEIKKVKAPSKVETQEEAKKEAPKRRGKVSKKAE